MRRPTCLAFVVLAALACRSGSASAPSPSVDDADATGGDGSAPESGAFGALDGAGPYAQRDAAVDASAPEVACAADAAPDGDVGACALPPSRCGNDETLVYFTGGTCVDGGCVWDVNELACPRGCAQGGCNPGPTR